MDYTKQIIKTKKQQLTDASLAIALAYKEGSKHYMTGKDYNNIDEYIESCETHVQPVLQELRNHIKSYAPHAIEKISWAMPTFFLKGNLVHFAAHKSHIGFYPGASGIEAFVSDFKRLGYKYSKGAVQFPFDKPLPWDLIQRIVEFRVNENIRPTKNA